MYLPSDGLVKLALYSTLGGELAVSSGWLSPGMHGFTIHAGSLPTGVYLLTVTWKSEVRTMTLLKVHAQESGATRIERSGFHGGKIKFPDMRKTLSGDTYTFIGYANGFIPDTMANLIPVGGQNYEFGFQPINATNKITMGTPVTVVQQVIPPTGGTIDVQIPGNPLNNLQIMVPDSAHIAARTYDISYAPIVSHQLGTDYSIISPMIIVGNGGGYADFPITLRIPVNVPKDHFAMAFFYYEKTEELEGLPMVDLDSTAVTVMTRHFALSDISNNGFTRAGGHTLTSAAISNIFVVSVKESYLAGQAVISTGFKPGFDDWEFYNYGSYIAPGGHCAGQSMTMMWYYYEQKLKGQPALYHAFDRIKAKNIWFDNPRGYRFASVVQKDIDFDGRIREALTSLYDSTRHWIGWRAFVTAMLLTGEPQYVGLRKYDAMGKIDGGHAIVAHKVSVSEGKVFVTDPNWPGEERTMQLENEQFHPYSSKQNANEVDSTAYAGIGYIAKTALIDWDKIHSRWVQFQDRTIGSIAPNVFPEYTIEINERLLKDEDSIVVASKAVDFKVFCPTCRYKFFDNTVHFDLIEENGSTSVENAPGLTRMRPQVPDPFDIAVFVLPKTTDTTRDFVDLRWLSIRSLFLRITADPDGIPITAPGRRDTLYRFTARTFGPPPARTRYDWTFGDGEPEQKRSGDSTMTHTYKSDGTFVVKVKIYDEDKAVYLGEEFDYAEIQSFEVTEILPAKDTTGAIVQIIGYGFGPTKGIFGKVIFPPGQLSTIVSWSDTVISVIVPSNALSGDVELRHDGSVERLRFPFSVVPNITRFNPTRIYANLGVQVVVLGTGFGEQQDTSRITIGGNPVTVFDSWSNKDIRFYTPNGLHSGPMIVYVRGNKSRPVFCRVGVGDLIGVHAKAVAQFAAHVTLNVIPGNTNLESDPGWQIPDEANLTGTLSWQGSSFSLSYTRVQLPGTDRYFTGQINGTLDSTGQMLKTATFEELMEDGSPVNLRQTTKYTFSDVPLSSVSEISQLVSYFLSGPETEQHVSNVEFKREEIWNGKTYTWLSTDWGNTHKPSVSVTFQK